MYDSDDDEEFAPPPELSPEISGALLKQDSVRQVMSEFLQAYDIETPLDDLSAESQASLLAALIADGAISLSAGQQVSTQEVEKMLEETSVEEDDKAKPTSV